MSLLKKAVQYGTYPIILSIVLGIIYLATDRHWDYKQVYGLTTIFIVFSLMTLERLFPLKKEWSMTRQSFLRDLKYLLLDAPTIILTKAAFGILAISFAENHPHGHLSQMSILAGTITYLLIFEFFQYWYHRLSHRFDFLWKIHLAHHLPDKVYVFMHGVFNPINIFAVTVLIQSLIILLGVSPEVALAATLMIDLQSLISHFNVGVRAGFLNYIFIGSETHRFHHSAKMEESLNFGNTLTIWDHVFGTFYYKPKQYPQKLGVDPTQGYPDSNRAWEVIKLPFS